MLDRGTSAVTPLLVRLYDTHRLYELAKDRREPARKELALVVLDLFQSDLNQRETELICDVLGSLIRQAERDLKRALAEQLSCNERVPLRLILQLANDEIEVAEAVLMHSPVLNELDLSYIIQARGPDYWRAVARRRDLTGHVVDVLADTREPGTLLCLMGNRDVRITDYAVEVIGNLAVESEEIARALIAREEFCRAIAEKIYRAVGQELQARIVDRFPEVASIVSEAIDEAVSDLTDVQNPEVFCMPSGRDVQTAIAAQRSGFLDVTLMLGTLREGRFPAFVAQFSCFARLDVDTVIEVLRQKRGQGLAVACRALDIEKADYLAMYLLTQRIRKATRIADKRDISRALDYFDRVKKEVAERILRNSRNLH
ncbi:MAG: DUF2336 domain-containing protein [Alphaproteobacteria bacterium]|nr:DUF2336 domain-containing protein [Alphaproteobacteria bacterium]